MTWTPGTWADEMLRPVTWGAEVRWCGCFAFPNEQRERKNALAHLQAHGMSEPHLERMIGKELALAVFAYDYLLYAERCAHAKGYPSGYREEAIAAYLLKQLLKEKRNDDQDQ